MLWGATKKVEYGDADYGAIVNSLAGQPAFMGTYPGVLDPDAAYVRNSDAHDDWDYAYETDSIVLRDRSKPSKVISVDGLVAKATNMLEVAGVMFPQVVRERKLAPIAAWFAGVEPIWAELLSSDPATQRAALQLLLEYVGKKPRR